MSKTSVCGSWGPIAGELRYFADRFGVPRASIEGTQIPIELVRRYATRGAADVVYDPRRKQSALALRRTLTYHGFELEREYEPLEEFPSELAGRIRTVLADALARGEARHSALKRHRPQIEEIREVYRRSGGATPRLGVAELTPTLRARAGRCGLDDRLSRDSADDRLRAPRACRRARAVARAAGLRRDSWP